MPNFDFQQIRLSASKTLKKVANFSIKDLSHTKNRTVTIPKKGENGTFEYTIDNPVALILIPGSSCHRVIDNTGKLHIYPQHCVISSEPKSKTKLVKF